MCVSKICLKRALRTFIQAFLGYVVVHLALIDFTDGKEAVKSALIGLAVSSIAAGLSAVMNLKGDGGSNENGSVDKKESRQGD